MKFEEALAAMRAGKNISPLKKRLLSKIEFTDDGCYEWTGATRSGYGCLTICDKESSYKYNAVYNAHRVFYKEFIGKIPEKMFVCHRCDNKKCVNPNHLFLGTPKQNTQDMISKKRHAHEERQGSSKLKLKDVIKIKKLLMNNISYRKVAKNFSVCQYTIYAIANKIHWKTVE